MVIADGSIVHLSKALIREKLNAAVVGLGALGVITKVTLQIATYVYDASAGIFKNAYGAVKGAF